MKAETLTRRQLNRATLARQMLLMRQIVSPVEAVECLCGMQAQEAKPPFIGLWSRVVDFDREDLCSALHRHEIVRATVMRGTLHLVSAAYYVAFRPVFDDMLRQALRLLGDRSAGLETDLVLPVAKKLLQEQPRTFTELRAALLASFPDVNERALGFAVRMLLPVLMVPSDDPWAFPSVARFTLAENHLDSPASPDRAPTRLVLRYLAAFGPATAADVQTWSGLQGMKGVLAEMRPNLRVFRDEKGRELFDVPDGPLPPEQTLAPARFLPDFDNLVLAHSDRSRLIADQYRGQIVTKNLRVRATFLWDGFVAGTWTIERKRDVATLVLAPFEALPAPAIDALTEEGEVLLRFAEASAGTYCVKWGGRAAPV